MGVFPILSLFLVSAFAATWPSSFPALQTSNSASLTNLPPGVLSFIQFTDPLGSEWQSYYYLKPAENPYIIRLPKAGSSYPLGLFAYIWAGNAGTLCDGFEWVLDKYNIIYIAPTNAGNFMVDGLPASQRVGRYTDDRIQNTIYGLTLVARAFGIDSSLITVGGLSGGGRVASALAYLHLDLVSGVIGNSGCDYFKDVGNGDAYSSDYTIYSLDVLRSNLRVAITTGPSDFRYSNLLVNYKNGFVVDQIPALFSNKSNQGHACPVNGTLDEVYNYLSLNVRKCNYPCKDCDGTKKSQCLSCFNGYLLGSSCVQNCPKGYGDNGNKVCLPCSTANCSSCTKDVCGSCISPFKLLNSKCVSSCGTGFYADYYGVCRACSVGCSSCAGASQCLVCTTGYKLTRGACKKLFLF